MLISQDTIFHRTASAFISKYQASHVAPDFPTLSLFEGVPLRGTCVLYLDITYIEILFVAGVQYEPWFEVPYTVELLSDEVLKRWADPEHVDLALRMPIVNAFIPHDFTIRTGKTETPDPDVPMVLLDEQGLKVWYKLDRTFNTPRANTYFSVTCKAASENIRNIVLTEIYVKLLEHELNETIYLVSSPESFVHTQYAVATIISVLVGCSCDILGRAIPH